MVYVVAARVGPAVPAEVQPGRHSRPYESPTDPWTRTKARDMPDPQKLLATIRRATELFRSTPGRAGGMVTLAEGQAEDVLVVGDLHGNLRAFSHFLKLAALDAHPRRHLILQELVHDPKADADGELPDLSHRLVDVVCALKCQYP